ncbi:MAG: sulfatase-like hydrolase/transferase [Thermoanaerobaculia bacterium]|nr:sulfatase-like hydrolase/transferase [Thermoanaerobaculia bacterium]
MVRPLLLGLLLTASAPVAPPSSTPPDVLLITIDTLRADRLGFAGDRRAATPNLDRLAATGRVFTDAHAHNVVTLPSHTNILTGLYPFQHGVRENSGFRLGADVPTMATLLAAQGYRTAAFVAAFPLDSRFGLDHGFEIYDDRVPKGSRPDEFVMPERRGDDMVARASTWWQAHRGQKRFLWLHLFDPHAPYDPPEPHATTFRDDPYRGEVAATDAFLGPLLEPFLAGREPAALVIVTADHGEALGDHGEATHGLFAYEPTLKVPLVIWGSGVTPGRDDRAARHVDLLPTVLAATGVAKPTATRLPGRSLLLPPDDGAAGESYFEALSAALNRGWAPLTGLIRDGRKAIQLPLPELYDLAADPGEMRNLAAEPGAAELLAAVPQRAWPPAPRERPAPEVEAQLRALGYVSGSTAVRERFGPEDDPKTLLALDRQIHQIVEAISQGRAAAAVVTARELVTARPSMPLGHSLLAQALLAASDTSGAVAAMERARREHAASEPLLRQLALSLAELGRAAEAVTLLSPFALTGELETRVTLAEAHSEAGRQTEAEALIAQVLSTDPEDPRALETSGLVALRQGRWALARDRSQQALEQNGTLPRAWNNLGVARFQLGDREGALDAWQKAVDFDPKLFDALYNLGMKAAAAGRTEQARRALDAFLKTAPASRYSRDFDKVRQALAALDGGR